MDGHSKWWWPNVLQGSKALDKAMEQYYHSNDKHVAIMASYKALGLDPRDAPKYGDGLLMAAPERTSIVQSQANNPLITAILGGILVTFLLWLLLSNGRMPNVSSNTNSCPPSVAVDQSEPPQKPTSPLLPADICRKLDNNPKLKAEVQAKLAEVIKLIQESE